MIETAVWLIDVGARETMLFAAFGFLIGGADDVLVDVIYLARRALRHQRDVPLAALPQPHQPGRFAIFVAAWDESAVIGAMLRAALARLRNVEYVIYVGCYPNDPGTIEAVAAVSGDNSRIRMVVGTDPGPTTKAGCLNTLWTALVDDDAAHGSMTRAVVLHDAEDVVHPDELTVYDAYLDRVDVVQIPVVPLIDRSARMVSGHYADEFSEAHSKTATVRVALGAGMPLAGVGCAIAMPMLRRLAERNGGTPFDASSLTEDYEIGLHIARIGGRACFARVREAPGGALVAVRAYFPATVASAIRQKARWMTGIALAGWDRTGWGRTLDIRDHWMRMRDRRAPIAVFVLASAYLSLVLLGASALVHLLTGTATPLIDPLLKVVLSINGGLLVWRLLVRAGHVAATHGRREALWSVPRMLVGNYIALFAARRAMGSYVTILRGGTLRWDKTAHVFPSAGPDLA